MTDIEWPEGATHRINGWFTKWEGGVEYIYDAEVSGWKECRFTGHPLNEYKMAEGFSIIERPKEPEAKEPVINWDEQPTPEHVLMVDSHLKTKHWVKMGIGCWMNDTGLTWSLKTEGTLYSIHTKPPASKETEPYKPEVGEWCELVNKRSKLKGCVFIVGYSDKGVAVFYFKYGDGKLLYAEEGDTFRPIKSEREQFIEKSKELRSGIYGDGAIFGKQYDNGARLTDEN